MVYDSTGKQWTNESAYQEGFFTRILLAEQAVEEGIEPPSGFAFSRFAENCPSELREAGAEMAAKLRQHFINGWKEASNPQ